MLYHRSHISFVHFNNTYFKDGHEGKGVYMSDTDNFKNYGKYVYNIEIDMKTSFYDFTSEKSILKIFKSFLIKYDTRKIISKELNNEDFKNYINGIVEGGFSITQLMKNTWDCIECDLYEKNYKFDLLAYNEKIIEKWDIFLFGGILKYYDIQFKQNVYLTKNINNIRIISIVTDVEN